MISHSLTSADHLLVLHVYGNGFQKVFLHHFPRHWGEADWWVVPWVLLLEYWSDIWFLPALRNLPQSPWSFKHNQEWPCNDISQFSQHLWVHPISPMDLCMFSLLKCLLAWSSSAEGQSDLLQTYPWVLGAWDSWRLISGGSSSPWETANMKLLPVSDEDLIHFFLMKQSIADTHCIATTLPALVCSLILTHKLWTSSSSVPRHPSTHFCCSVSLPSLSCGLKI